MMKSRSSINQKDKKNYIKRGFLILGMSMLTAGCGISEEEQSSDPAVDEPTSPSENQQAEAPENKPESPETPEEKPAEKPEQKPEQKEEEKPEQKEEEKAEQKQEEKAPEKDAGQKPETKTPPADKNPDATQYPENAALPAEPTVINGILLANKQHPLPETYAPGEVKEARAAFEAMRAEALKAGIDLTAFSTYRNFTRQKELYTGYVAKDGQAAADRYSARPGYSEHQTGLAFDIGESGEEQHWASSSFGGTEGGKWLKDNAHNFGFILRYPEGAEKITGYMHESWHYRYVGKKAAAEIYSKGITLEEYLGVN